MVVLALLGGGGTGTNEDRHQRGWLFFVVLPAPPAFPRIRTAADGRRRRDGRLFYNTSRNDSGSTEVPCTDFIFLSSLPLLALLLLLGSGRGQKSAVPPPSLATHPRRRATACHDAPPRCAAPCVLFFFRAPSSSNAALCSDLRLLLPPPTALASYTSRLPTYRPLL